MIKTRKALALATISIATLIMSGWIFSITWLVQPLAIFPTIKFNTALLFLVFGIILWIEAGEQPRRTSRYSTILTILALLFSTTTFLEYSFGISLGLDQLFISDQLSPSTDMYPGRMSPGTTMQFILFGIALLALKLPFRGSVAGSQMVIGILLIISLIIFSGYVYGVQSLYEIFLFSTVSPITLLTFFLLSITILLLHPAEGWMRFITVGSTTGFHIRMLLLLIAIIPFVIGLTITQMADAHYFDYKIGFAIFAVFSIVGLSLIILLSARSLLLSEKKRDEVEKIITDKESLLRLVLETLPIGVWIMDRGGNIQYGNSAGRKIWEGAKYVGIEEFGEYKGWWHDTGKLIEPGEWAAARAIQKGEVSLDEVIDIQCFDGSYKTMLNSALPIRDSENAIVGAIITNQDITGRIAQERDLRLRNVALETAANAILMTDTRGDIIWVNEAFTKMTGYSLEESIGKNPRDLIKSGQHDEQFYKNLWDTILSGNVWRGTMLNKRKNGVLYPEEQTITPVRDASGKITHFIAIKLDITIRKEYEAQLREYADKLEAINANKDKFFSLISHDLRGPFSTLQGFVSLLIEESNEMQSEKTKRIVNNIDHLTHNISELLINLLDWSRIQLGNFEMDPHPVHLRGFLKTTFELFSESAGAKRISLQNDVDDSIFIVADTNMLQSILRNFLSNAIKFTPQGGTVRVAAREEHAQTIVEIRDTGLGMNRELLTKLFRVGERVTRLGTANEKGSGLGLLLSKEFIEKHGGRIWIESIEGEGTTFHFSIPQQ